MTQLHALFHLRDQQRFQRVLESARAPAKTPALSTSGGRSWTKPNPLAANPNGSGVDVNARDWLGRTVLHLACASPEPYALEFARLLFAHPAINVNLADAESHWTALHRALYHGNLAAAMLLLKRPDTDVSLKDLEGYTAYDLYNSTVEGTKPDHAADADRAELFTWGANRNAALGLGDASDRAFPELVPLKPPHTGPALPLRARFTPPAVRAVAMSKLHTIVLTAPASCSSSPGQVLACGFGSGGRLGGAAHTQFTLTPVTVDADVVGLALGQDHTLVVTRAGEVFSWGLNRFAQLGYIVEGEGAHEGKEEIQWAPKRVMGPLRREFVKGAAACRSASACWTEREVFTWGTNGGQLGYDKAAQPVQVQPRIVTKITQPVRAVAISDSALACLLAGSGEVICIHDGRSLRINFPAQAFPSEITPYRPPAAVRVRRVVSAADGAFAALSDAGEVFTFTFPSASSAQDGARTFKPAPARVWALRKQFSAVTDVALGADGALAICTESGHVYVRERGSGGGKAFRFRRVPYVQRVVRVCANDTGAFGALRVDGRPPEIKVHGRSLAQDMKAVMPWNCWRPVKEPTIGTRRRRGSEGQGSEEEEVGQRMPGDEGDEDAEDAPTMKDVQALRQLCALLREDKECRAVYGGRGLFEREADGLAHGADLLVQTQSGFLFPAHAFVARVRCTRLGTLLESGGALEDAKSGVSVRVQKGKGKGKGKGMLRVVVGGCEPLAVLLLFRYLYSDELPAVWDRRIGFDVELEREMAALRIGAGVVKLGLQALARVLEMPALAEALQSVDRRAPTPTMEADMRRAFGSGGEGTGDVVLRLADREVVCAGVVLRARSPLFAGFFDEPVWTEGRRTAEGRLEVDFGHVRWRAVQFAYRWMCRGEEREMFERLEFIENVDELLDLLFEVIAVATELHLDRLVLVCAETIREYVNLSNACSILADATYYSVAPLIKSVQAYLAMNMETLLESQMLTDLTPDLIKQLSTFMRGEQKAKSPVSRSSLLVDNAMRVYGGWLEAQDIPKPIVHAVRGPFRDSPKLSPPTPHKKDKEKGRRLSGVEPTSLGAIPSLKPTTSIRALAPSGGDDDIFAMDVESVPVVALEPPMVSASPPKNEMTSPSDAKPAARAPQWKTVTAAPRADMKSIMAEAATAKVRPIPAAAPSGSPGVSKAATTSDWRKPSTPVSGSVALPTMPRTPSGSPWKAISPPAPMRISSGPVPASGISLMRDVPTAGFHPSTPPSTSVMLPKPTTPSRGQSAQNVQGPVIKPTRQPSSSSPSVARKTSGTGKAWTLLPAEPSMPTMSPMGPAPSLVAIQQLQLEQAQPQEKSKRSLKEIQEEERARHEEEAFMRWWAAEEERVRVEEMRVQAEVAEIERAAAGAPSGSKKKDGPRKPRKPKPPKDTTATAPAASSGGSNATHGPESRAERGMRGGRNSTRGSGSGRGHRPPPTIPV